VGNNVSGGLPSARRNASGLLPVDMGHCADQLYGGTTKYALAARTGV